jgi:hypothetical protein
VEELPAQSIEAAKRASVIKPASIRRVIVDTTVMAKDHEGNRENSTWNVTALA